MALDRRDANAALRPTTMVVAARRWGAEERPLPPSRPCEHLSKFSHGLLLFAFSSPQIDGDCAEFAFTRLTGSQAKNLRLRYPAPRALPGLLDNPIDGHAARRRELSRRRDNPGERPFCPSWAETRAVCPGLNRRNLRHDFVKWPPSRPGDRCPNSEPV